MPKVNKVLLLVENLTVPADPRVWAEATTLRDNGYQVSIICPKGPYKHRESYLYLEDIHIYRFSLPAAKGKYTAYLAEYGVASLMIFLLSFKVLFQRGFDVIHTANPPDIFFIIGLFYRLFGKKFIFDQHDLAPEMFQVKFKGRSQLFYHLLLFFERRSYRTADIVITTNESKKQLAISRGGCNADRVFVVRNGPNLKRLSLVPPEPELKRGRKYLLAYIGVMGTQDGVEYALQALDLLVHQRGRQDISMVLMGEGDNVPNLRQLSHDLSLDEFAHFAGWTEAVDIRRYLSTADIGLSPDPANGLNERSTMIKTMEYMAMGLPIAAFDLEETHYSAQNAALYAQSNNIEEFANNIETLLNNDALRKELGQIGRKRIENELSWSYSQKKLLQAYDVLFAKKKEPTTSATPDADKVAVTVTASGDRL